MNPKLARAAEWIAGILVTAAVLFLMLVRATKAGPLWRDEAAAVQLAQFPTVGEIAASFQHEAFPLPFSLLLRGYMSIFGQSDASLRSFGFLVGLLLVGISWFNSRILSSRGPILFLALFGLNVTFLTWGISVRGYGPGCALLLLTLGLTTKTILQPTRSNAIAATIASIGSVQFMLNAVPLIAAIAASIFAAFIFQRRTREALIVAICAMICALSLVPYANSYLSADWNAVLKYPTTVLSLWEKCRLALEQPSIMAALFWYVAVPSVLIGAIGRCWLTRGDKSATDARVLLFLILVGLLSVFAYLAFLKILSYATRPWYFLPLLCVLAGVAELISATLSRFQSVIVGRVLFAIAALLLLPAGLWPSVRTRLTNIDVVAHKLEIEAGPSDLIVLNPWHFGPSFHRYYHGSTRWITVPTMSEHRIHRYDLMKSKMVEADPLADALAAMRETLRSNHAVWIVGGARPRDPEMPHLGPAPNPYFGWAGYMSFWSMEIGSFLNEHVANGAVVLEPALNTNDGENVPLLVARGWRD